MVDGPDELCPAPDLREFGGGPSDSRRFRQAACGCQRRVRSGGNVGASAELWRRRREEMTSPQPSAHGDSGSWSQGICVGTLFFEDLAAAKWFYVAAFDQPIYSVRLLPWLV